MNPTESPERPKAAHRALIAVLIIQLLLFIPFFSLSPAQAGISPDFPLPSGQVTAVLPASVVNQDLMDQGRATPSTLPFTPGSDVWQITTDRDMYFVRYYSHDPSRFQNGSVGGWVMPASDVMGLQINQARDRFALPQMPDHLVVVKVPAGTSLQTGQAGPIAGWGQGGGQQVLLVDRIPAGNYEANLFLPDAVETAPFGQRAGAMNARVLGGYLDGLTGVSPFSYLEVTRLCLQYRDDPSMSRALNQMGAGRYDTFTWLLARASAAFTQSVWDRLAEAGGPSSAGPGFWSRAYGGLGNREDHDEVIGFDYGLAGVSAGIDRNLGPNLIWGAGLGASRTTFHFTESLGRGDLDSLNLALYGGWRGEVLFLDLTAGGGLSDGRMHRRVNFPGIDRTALSDPQGYGFSASASAGGNLPLGEWTFTPRAGAEIVYSEFDGLTEGGAGDLNLTVDSFDAWTLAVRLGGEISREMEIQGGVKFAPLAGLYYRLFLPLDDREIEAGLLDYGGRFTVQGDDGAVNEAVPMLGFSVRFPGGADFRISYEAGIGQDLTAHLLGAGLTIPF